MSRWPGPARQPNPRIRRPAGAGVAVGLASALLLSGCAPVADAAAPSPLPETHTPTPTPAPARPFQTIDSTCDRIVALGTLEAAAGAGLTPGGPRHDHPLSDAMMSAAVQNAGGFACTWSDSETGELRVTLTVVPEAAAADERIRTEFAARHGTAPGDAMPLTAGCVYDYCMVKGISGSTDVNLFVLGMPWSDSGAGETPAIQAIRDEVAAHLDALPAAQPLPAPSATWGNGPISCEEMLAPERLASHLALGSVTYDVGYAYEESNGWDVALLTAGGYTCRYLGDGASGGRITVLPDAAGVLASISPSGDLRPIDVPGAGAGVVDCWSNGDPFEAGSGQCTVHVAIRGAWTSVLTASTNTSAERLEHEAVNVAAALASALG